MEKESKSELELKRDLITMSFELDEKRHHLKMKELEFIRESDRLHHERELERQRIKTAEIRKNRQWQENKQFAENYHK